MTQQKGRRRRLSDAETERRVLDAAIDKVHHDGLRVGFDQLGLEEVIAAADVSRSTVYRKWPSRDDFYRALLIELLASGRELIHRFEADHIADEVSALFADPRSTATPGARRAAVVELSRLGVRRNYAMVRDTPGRRNFEALLAVVNSTSGDVGAHAKRLLRENEDAFPRRMDVFYVEMLRRVGWRLRPGVTGVQLAAAGSVLVHGFVCNSGTLPDEVLAEHDADPFDTGLVRPWNTVSLAYTGLVLSLAEPDPTVDPAARPD